MSTDHLSDSLSISGVIEAPTPTGPPKLPPKLPAKKKPEPTPEAAPPAEDLSLDDQEPPAFAAVDVTAKPAAKKTPAKKAPAKTSTKSKPADDAETAPVAERTKGQPESDETDETKSRRKREVPEPRERPAGILEGLFFDIREWFATQGLWWGASAITHAVVLAGGLLLIGTAVKEHIHSVAPAFEAAGGIDTAVGAPPDIDSFDMQTGSVDPLSNDGAAVVDSNARVGGDFVTAGASGAAGGGSGPGGGPKSTFAGAVAGGGGGPGGGGGGAIGSTANIGGMEMRSVIPGFGHGSQRGQGGGRRRSMAAMGGVVGAGDVNGAVDGLIGGISREMEAGDLLVVWLIDASISLVEDRQKVADRIEPFYRAIESRGKGMYRLQNAVVAFGSTTVEVVKPTSYSQQITAAIRELPVDPSGKEMVMTSVRQVMEEYGKVWKGGMMIIVWTDESGDDILQLEETIYTCRKRNALVNVVGPTSVLGSERGRHHWVDKPTGHAFLLPIKRGPDTCLPERVFMPYWWDSPLSPWINNGIIAAHGVPWYGGPHREGILSGTGPYALTRLALETGGQFILLDRAEDKSQFSMENMKRYLTEYGSPEEYVKSVNSHPLRRVTSEAVQATYTVVNLWPPTTAFILRRDNYYPFGIHSTGYMTPPKFRELLKEELPTQLAHANAAAEVIETALAKFPAGGMESEYAGERSARWRAWYDLTRGRLLAMSIRTLEYKLAVEKIWSTGYLLPDTNKMALKPSSTHLSGSVGDERAKEAIRLLTRCKVENAGTPWQLLAEWELKHEFGIEIVQTAIPPPKPSPPPKGPPPKPRPAPPKIVFPSL